MKSYYYYIDEAGGLDNNSNFFILGCYKTDTPEKIRSSIEKLQNEITNSPYFAFERKKFTKQGFHACDNHFDIRARFYNLISVLNFRAYILIVDKKSDFYKQLQIDKTNSSLIYNVFVEKLLTDRLIKHRKENNILIFEQYGSKPNKWVENLKNVVKNISTTIKNNYRIDLSYEVKVHDKSDLNIAVIDYLNFLFIQFYEHGKVQPRMLQNFQIVEPKIGLIYKMDKDEFYNINHRINVKEY